MSNSTVVVVPLSMSFIARSILPSRFSRQTHCFCSVLLCCNSRFHDSLSMAVAPYSLKFIGL